MNAMSFGWKFLPLVLLVFGTGCGLSSGGSLKERALMKTGWGAQTCELSGCLECPDYCPKCLPQQHCLQLCQPPCYCPKPLPCTQWVCGEQCCDYCPKSAPCPRFPTCPPESYDYPRCAVNPAPTETVK